MLHVIGQGLFNLKLILVRHEFFARLVAMSDSDNYFNKS
jgi:hypothetical protein